MTLLQMLRWIPFANSKLAMLHPRLDDLLLSFFGKNDPVVFFDIGANTGQTIDYITKLFPNASIFSFEPTPRVFRELYEKYEGTKNVYLFDIALAESNGRLDFYTSDFSPTNSCLQPNDALYGGCYPEIKEALSDTKTIQVDALTLDSWYAEYFADSEKVDIVKIDVQGFEYNVLQGGMQTLREKTKMLYLEVQYLEFYKNAVPFYKIFELLYENGFYQYCHIGASKRNKFQMVEADVLFVNSKFFKLGG
jgi:FkbM family methyltransferase